MFVSVRKKERDYLLVIRYCLLLLSTRHTEVTGMPGDTSLTCVFLKEAVEVIIKRVQGAS